MIKKILNFLKFVFRTTQLGFYYICFVLSEGFYFYFFLLFLIIEKIFRLRIFSKIKNYFKEKQKDPVSFLVLVLVFLIFVFLYTYLYVDKNDVTYVDNGVIDKDGVVGEDEYKGENGSKSKSSYKDTNLYRKYGSMDLNSVDFNELKKTNGDVVAWIRVDGTNVNYPIVQTNNNDYYLNHDIEKNPKVSGWTFMDFRNAVDMSDNNTIFYGHNLLNKTAFGSLVNLFTKKWFKSSNHYIVVLTENKRFLYEVFSCYIIDPEVYYLQNKFYTEGDYSEFLNILKSRSKFDFNVDLNTSDKIITLSTCTDDNKNRRVVHAKLIEG